MRADQILAWTLSFRKRLYCHSRRKFWESLRIDRIQMWYQYHRILHRTHQDFVNPSTFNVSDWCASSSWPSYCWSLISSTSYSSTSPTILMYESLRYAYAVGRDKGSRRRTPLDYIVDSRYRYWSLSICHHRHPRSPVVVCTKLLLLFFLLPLLPLPPVPLQRCC